MTQAPALPATTLAGNCYYKMFSGCTSLISTPSILPATILDSWCYCSMFQGCTSLIHTPLLPATELVGCCYYRMFLGCTSLTAAPKLPATTLASSCYEGMFSGCSKLASMDVNFTTWGSSGGTYDWVNGVGTDVSGEKTFTCPSTLPKIYSNHYIPSGWTVIEK